MMARNDAVEKIAKWTLGMTTLKVRGREALDEYSFDVRVIRTALEEAFDAGHCAGYDLAKDEFRK